jgi:glycosyltransferase involved in cell wall biosynthesis
VVGPTPPPVHGVSQTVAWLLESPTLSERLHVLHLDTSDRRSAENLGRVDLRNVLIGLKNVFAMLRLCARERPCLIYCTLSQNTPALLRDSFLMAVAQAFKARSVVQLAGSRYLGIVAAGGLAGRLVRRALEKASLVLVLGQSQVRSMVDATGHQRVGVAPNGLPFQGVKPAREVRSGPCSFLTLGSLTANKGLFASLDALAELMGSGRECRATFAGSWPSPEQREQVLATVQRLGLSDRVEFPGVVQGDEKQALFEQAAVYLLPSFGEGQPVSILEAMAYGLPVLSTRVGAIPDTVIDGETGILVQPGDKAALVAAMVSMIDDPGLRTRMGKAGATRCSKEFTLAHSHEMLRDHLLRVAEAV